MNLYLEYPCKNTSVPMLGQVWQNSGYGELLGFEEMGFGIYKMLVYIRALAFLNKTKVFVFVVPFGKGGEIPIDTSVGPLGLFTVSSYVASEQ